MKTWCRRSSRIFEQLYRLGYPVEKIRTVDHYSDADDELSMEDNNTSAFNCRRIPGTNEWSPHAYGRAIDLNPLLNPCLYASGYFEPQNAAAYLDRSRTDPGLLHDGDPAVHIFTDRGWRWGGDWTTPDYQHFEWPLSTHCAKDPGPGPSSSQPHLADSTSVDCLAYGSSSRAELCRYLSPGLSKARFR